LDDSEGPENIGIGCPWKLQGYEWLTYGQRLRIIGMSPWKLSKTWLNHNKESKGQVSNVCKTQIYIKNIDITWRFRKTDIEQGVVQLSKYTKFL